MATRYASVWRRSHGGEYSREVADRAGIGFSELLSFVVDPFITVPRSHTANLTLQRELKGNIVLELGYIGRYGRNLYQSLNLNQVPYMFRDNASGQTFAQAFDAAGRRVAGQRAVPRPSRRSPGSRTCSPVCRHFGCPHQGARASNTANIINGNMSNLFLSTMDSLPAAQSFDNLQVLELFMRTSLGRSNYNGFFTTVRKRFSRGLAFDANYTWSRSLDQVGAVQNSASAFPELLRSRLRLRTVLPGRHAYLQ